MSGLLVYFPADAENRSADDPLSLRPYVESSRAEGHDSRKHTPDTASLELARLAGRAFAASSPTKGMGGACVGLGRSRTEPRVLGGRGVRAFVASV